MGDAAPAAVFLLGHWNDASSGCPKGADVPEVHAVLGTLPGCDSLGVRLKYMDGHVHCNHAGGTRSGDESASDEVGFMIGGHGMSGCSQYGFALVDSTGGRMRILYFEERSPSSDTFETILTCVREAGLAGCTHLASVWLDSPINEGGGPVPVEEPVTDV